MTPPTVEIEQFHHYTATVKLRRDIAKPKPESERLDGTRIRVEAAWLIEEGPFAGEWAMTINREDLSRRGIETFGWIASSNLIDITPIEGNQSMTQPITLVYRNYRGEVAERTITPHRIWYGATEWHPEPQWLVNAWDDDKQAFRDFALADFMGPPPVAAVDRPLTRDDLIAALEAVWNAAIGEAHRQQEGMAFAAILAESARAMAEKLREETKP